MLFGSIIISALRALKISDVPGKSLSNPEGMTVLWQITG
jgi:hypothetical protein